MSRGPGQSGAAHRHHRDPRVRGGPDRDRPSRVVAERQVSPSPATPSSKSTVSPAPSSTVNANASPALTGGGPGGWLLAEIGAASRRASAPLVLTGADRRDCPAAAIACVDLTMHLTWLQSGGKVTFGPVLMEPGQPGSRHETPRGTFHVAWKAGPAYVSDDYHDAMPWADVLRGGRHRVPRRQPHPVVARLRAPDHAERPLLQRSPARRRGGRRLLTVAMTSLHGYREPVGGRAEPRNRSG